MWRTYLFPKKQTKLRSKYRKVCHWLRCDLLDPVPPQQSDQLIFFSILACFSVDSNNFLRYLPEKYKYVYFFYPTFDAPT